MAGLVRLRACVAHVAAADMIPAPENVVSGEDCSCDEERHDGNANGFHHLGLGLVVTWGSRTLQTRMRMRGSIGDTFAVSITGVSTTKFTANIVRVDASPGWGQNLRLGYAATTP